MLIPHVGLTMSTCAVRLMQCVLSGEGQLSNTATVNLVVTEDALCVSLTVQKLFTASDTADFVSSCFCLLAPFYSKGYEYGNM